MYRWSRGSVLPGALGQHRVQAPLRHGPAQHCPHSQPRRVIAPRCSGDAASKGYVTDWAARRKKRVVEEMVEVGGGSFWARGSAAQPSPP